MPSQSVLSGPNAIDRALRAVGERLGRTGATQAVVIAGGAAMNLLGVAERPTRDVDVLAVAAAPGADIRPPDPLPGDLTDAIATVARDLGLPGDWMNTTVAGQWRFGLPPGLPSRIHWKSYAALTVGIVDRRDLVFFKLYAAADQIGPDNVHVRDLVALRPSAEELESAAAWVRGQDPSPDFHAVVQKVVAYVRQALR